MGNEASSLNLLAECTIDESPIVSSGDWTLHHAQRDEDPAQLSVYVAKAASATAAGGKKNRNESLSQLELLEKNLKLYRHPKILRFLNCCTSPTNFSRYLFTEKTSPLALVRGLQSPLQVCLGVHDVVEALNFLHDKAGVCHNNVAQSSILVTPEGRFKLGGLEFVAKFDEVNQAFLDKTRQARHVKAIAPEEVTPDALKNHRARDAFALGVLIEELFEGVTNEELPGLDSLLYLASQSGLQSKVPANRPELASILREPVFTQDYINLVGFLTELPLKSKDERKTFFDGLTQRLFAVPEETVAVQLAPLLLSRLVLLDETAKSKFLPSILTCYSGNARSDFDPDSDVNPLLSEHLFKEHVTPILLKIFYVRDFQIRSVLLSHFTSYCRLFSSHVLEDEILPQLLLGMRDTSDEMVSSTLRALADLVPILGARIVVSKNRRKVFCDGSPGEQILAKSMSARSNKVDSRKKEKPVPMAKRESVSTDRSATQSPPSTAVPSQRHSPIGAEYSEDDQEEPMAQQSAEKREDDPWDSWDVEEVDKRPESKEASPLKMASMAGSPVRKPADVTEDKYRSKKFVDVELDQLDIKSSKTPGTDFFTDMVPVILKKKSLLERAADEVARENAAAAAAAAVIPTGDKFSALAATAVADGEDGWGGSEGDWENE